MSIEIMSRVWEHSKAEGTELLVMLALADFCDDQGVCFPGVSRIAQKCRISKRSVQRIITSMECRGEICREISKGLRVSGDRGDGSTNRYRITIKGCQSGTPIKPNCKKGGDKSGRKGVTNSAQGGDTAMSSNPSVEPSVEPSVSSSSDDEGVRKTTFEDIEDPFLTETET